MTRDSHGLEELPPRGAYSRTGHGTRAQRARRAARRLVGPLRQLTVLDPGAVKRPHDPVMCFTTG